MATGAGSWPPPDGERLDDPSRERHHDDLFATYSHRGTFIGYYPARLRDHIRDNTEREAREFERLAELVGTSPVNGGRGSKLNGWFDNYSGKERTEK